MPLLPQGTLLRGVVETLDRALGWLRFGEFRTLSSLCGERLKAGNAPVDCKCLCGALDRAEPDHCQKNAGKP